ncbi:MAG: glycosyltransferase [Novosphingobium sp.]
MKPNFLRSPGESAFPIDLDEGLRPARPAPAPAPVRVGYLVNVYPKVSHSFIQTEITALERQGLVVDRFTIRRSPETFDSDEDRAEAGRTASLLDGNKLGLLAAAGRWLLRHPRKTGAALVASLRIHGIGNAVHACAYLAEAAALAEQLERRGIRHVHVHFGTNSAAVARLAARIAPITYSFTAHGPDEFDSPRALDLRGKIAEAAFVAGVSSFGRGQLMRWSDPSHWSRIHVVRCAVAPRFLLAEPGDGAGLATTRLVCVARLDAQKGLPLLLDAAARVARRRAFTLDIIGDGPGRATMEATIAARGLAGHVRLLGWQAPEEVRRAVLESRALVLASFAEGLPVVLMEALAVGRPVIATGVAGVPELVDQANGWLIPSGSVDAIADALEAVLDAPVDRLEAMGEVGRTRVRAMHDPDGNARELAELLRPWA